MIERRKNFRRPRATANRRPKGSRVRLLFFACCLTLAVAANTPSRARVAEDVSLGAIRWDAWYEGAPDQKVLEQTEWAYRAPFFARYNENGKLLLDGDKEYVLHAEVAYARAIGIDYFIFGFYPDTGSWGRDVKTTMSLNRALVTYLRLPDRMGIKFAISINQLYPITDVDDIALSLATFVGHPAYMRTEHGTAPVFVLAHDGLDWSQFFGTDDKARGAIAALRRIIRERTGKEITFLIMNYDSVKANEASRRYDLDMVTTYSNFAPGKGAIENSYRQCVLHGEGVWARAALNKIPYAPNVTLGWDNRPRRARAVNPKELMQGPWCAAPEIEPLTVHFEQAVAFARNQAGPVPFRTVTIYSWNEFTEGGWMAPTMRNGDGWLEMLRAAIGRNRTAPPVELTWPDRLEPVICPMRTAERPREMLVAKCTQIRSIGPDWPCPPGTRKTSETVRAPSGYESMVWLGGWRAKICE